MENEYFNILIEYFQDRQDWQRVHGKKCFTDSFCNVYLTTEDDFNFIEIWHIEGKTFLLAKINITGNTKKFIKSVLELHII